MRPTHPPQNPSPISIPNSPPSRKRKRSIRNPSSSLSPWRTRKQQQIYSSNLISSLSRLRRSPPTSLAVRSAADRALATTARGRSRWSRAILRRVHIKARRPTVRSPAVRSPAAAVEAKARVLARLVPGCRKLPLPLILDEVSDYIAALEVQVRAMSVLAGVLSGLGGGSPAIRSRL